MIVKLTTSTQQDAKEKASGHSETLAAKLKCHMGCERGRLRWSGQNAAHPLWQLNRSYPLGGGQACVGCFDGIIHVAHHSRPVHWGEGVPGPYTAQVLHSLESYRLQPSGVYEPLRVCLQMPAGVKACGCMPGAKTLGTHTSGQLCMFRRAFLCQTQPMCPAGDNDALMKGAPSAGPCQSVLSASIRWSSSSSSRPGSPHLRPGTARGKDNTSQSKPFLQQGAGARLRSPPGWPCPGGSCAG